ncbi:MAG TPA: LysE family transporter, partial [Tepidisphaeraceae bacterium]|nr:LysE family transporter [Tepidisphaeraceae bacterium]
MYHVAAAIDKSWKSGQDAYSGQAASARGSRPLVIGQRGYRTELDKLQLLQFGVILGLGAAAPIGPVNVEIARRALRQGFAAAVALGCGAVSVDLSYTILSAAGVTRFTHNPWIYWPLALTGTGVLVFLGISSLRGARSAARQPLANPGNDRAGNCSGWRALLGGYVTGVLMTATNPMTVAFWFTVLPALAGT